MIEKNQQTPQEEQVIVPQSPIDPAFPKKSKWLFILLLILIAFTILFMPIPFRYGIVFCKPCADMRNCPKCPEEGSMDWNPSIAQSLFIRLTQSGSGAIETSYLSTPTPKPISDPTANWKTYINSQLGYEIKYPPTWQIIERSYKGIRPVEIESKERMERSNAPKYSIEISDRLKIPAYFKDFNLKNYEEVARFVGEGYDDPKPIVEKKSNSNLSVYYYVTYVQSWRSSTGMVSATLHAVIIPIPNTREDFLILDAEAYPYPDGDNELAIKFGQILSTFKFLP